MHGNMQISAKEMARFMGPSPSACATPKRPIRSRATRGRHFPVRDEEEAPVYIESSILELSRIYINAGSRGLLAAMSPGTPARPGTRPRERGQVGASLCFDFFPEKKLP